MQHIAIIYKRTRREAAQLAWELRVWLRRRGIEVFCRENVDTADVCCGYPTMELPAGLEAVVVLGGDGTFLSVARLLENRSTPVIGVNLGGLGFLTEITTDTCFEEINAILEGRYEIEERMRLRVSIMRDGQSIFDHKVLNDVVINKGALARILELKTSIDKRHLTYYRGDGLIVSTPTGSTAYNLSAGGPIVHPAANAIILTPICSFTLTNRPIIFPSQVSIQVELGEPNKDITLTCDGQVGCALAASDQIIISAADNPLRLIKTPTIDYFEILRTKLKWGTGLTSTQP